MRMLNGRLYRAGLVPVAIALAIAAFSMTGRPLPLTSTLAPDAFEGQPAMAELGRLAAQFPQRRPGSAGDGRLAAYVARTLESLGGSAGGGFSVRTEHFEGQTIEGERRLTTVIAQRPGSTEATPIVIVAHRDAAAAGAEAELSATAALLELARVFAARETKRTIVLVSTSGGSGGDAGAADFLDAFPGPFDAAIVLGDLAGTRTSTPVVVPYSDGFGSASLQLQRTVSDAVMHESGIQPGAPSALGQLAHLAFPLAAGEQGVLDARGLPAVLVQASGEAGPGARETVSAERLEGLGRSVLSSVDALDGAPDIPASAQTGVVLKNNVLPEWAVRLLTAALLVAPLLVATDALARLRRRRRPVGRWALWTLGCALPFLACALFAWLLGLLGIIPAPAAPAPPSSMPFDGAAVTAVVAVTLTFALAWLLWHLLLAHLRWEARPDADAAGIPMLLVLLAVCAIVWVGDPYTALLLLPATHIWLLLASPELRPRRLAALGLVAAGLLPLALLALFYSRQLGLGPGGGAWTAVLLLAGGHVSLLSALLWSVALGCGVVAGMLALAPAPPPLGPRGDGGIEITVRGPLTYAGPGSLGGTESALRR